MKDDSFILVSLKDKKSKKLAQILTNDSSRKIIDYLSKNEGATESKISKELKLPISTVHYNLKHLCEGDIIKGDEYHYSEKGKEVIHYNLANKFIIIAPESTFGFKQKLRSILPAGIIAFGATIIIKILSLWNFGGNEAPKMLMESSVRDSANIEAMRAPIHETLIEGTQKYSLYSDIALWFFFGVIFTVILYLVIEYLREKKVKAKKQ